MTYDVPDHLGQTGKRFWTAVVTENEGLGPEDFALLEIACENLDTVERCRKRVNKDGLLIAPPPHKKPIIHPAEEIRKAAQIRFQSALKQLDLGVEPELAGRTTKVIPYNRRIGRPTPGTTPLKAQ